MAPAGLNQSPADEVARTWSFVVSGASERAKRYVYTGLAQVAYKTVIYITQKQNKCFYVENVFVHLLAVRPKP